MSSVEFAEKLYEQFIKSSNMKDLDVAVALFRKGIAELPGKSAVILLDNLGCVLNFQSDSSADSKVCKMISMK